ncbi:MAG: aminotransferase class V-fold PLP-dependent enzyme [Gammaproteobacteria bacterium]|nr:aminotransferase class V-fold PLP-dependent enzyme [Gammaproteobacteria bacterium]MBU2285203.1 aminotransferase class V-fold PLP-dependent enzyme [Gammaproteobacteria bacterium]
MTPLPKEGIAWPELKEQLQEAGKADVDWRGGRVPMFIHYAGDDVLDVAKQAYLMYFSENGLGLRAFGSLQRFESEVVEMGLGLLHGGELATGAMTTGGTESIFLAVKAARDQAVQRKPSMGKPQIVMAESAHPAFSKAAHFMGMESVRTPLRADFTADPDAIAAAITPDTVMVVGSVPAFPHGVVDPIPELGQLALEREVWLHVDACVGGYFAPFARQLGVQMPDWDFLVPGVVSISADLHKYGYTAKGASTLFFRDAASFAGMGWYFDKWPRGQYFTNTLVGTRAGGAIAAAWAVMRYLGEDGYRRITRRVLLTRARLQAGVARLGFGTFGDPRLSILSYGSAERDIAAIGAGMTRRGWTVGYVSNPDGLHHMLNLTHEPVVDAYLDDLAAAVAEAPSGGGERVVARY